MVMMGDFGMGWFWPFGVALAGAWLIVAILLIVFWILMIIDAATRNFKNDIEKIVWIIVIIVTNWIGALGYFIVIRALNPRGIVRK